MRVQKIILANPEVFNIDPSCINSEIDAIQQIASMPCDGHELQKMSFKIRQTHTAIHNLISLGFRDLAVDLAIDVIPEAEKTHNFKIAQDLCEFLMSHYYKLGDIASVKVYTLLYDKFSEVISHEHQSLVLYETTINNYHKITFQDREISSRLLRSIENKLPFDPLNHHYYYFQYRSFLLIEGNLEHLYFKAIDYFNGLYFKHTFFATIFISKLVQLYLKRNKIKKAEVYLQQLDPGSLSWFRNYLIFVKALLKNKDIYSNNICIMVMEHSNFVALHYDLKEAWKAEYKASVRLLLEN